MSSAFQFSENQILAFALILLRVSGFIVSWPVFGTPSVPSIIKVLLALTLTLVVMPATGWESINGLMASNQIIWLALKEAIVGVMLGFLCRLYFFAIAIGGEMVSVSMGLSNGQIMNPTLGARGSAVEQFQVTLATLLFLAINGHHLFLHGLAQSFNLIPLSQMGFSFDSFVHFGSVVQEIVVIGIKISAPVMISILFMNISMGIVGRAVPQINVLITSLPVNILTGFFILIFSVPLFITEMDSLMSLMAERLFTFMKGL